MADLVNDTAKKQLSPKNQEPTHLGGASYQDLGGTKTDSKPNSVKINATSGLSKDTTIPSSVEAEPSHLPNASGVEDKMDLAFGEEGDHTEVDDLDKELDDLDNLHEVEIEIGKKDKDDDDDKEEDKDKKDLKEEEDDDDKKVGLKDIEEEDDEDDDKKDLKEDDDNPFKKKDDDGDDDDDDKGEKKDKGAKIVVKEEDEDKDEDDKDEKKEVSESFRVVISTPASNLFESAGLAPKTQKKVATIFEQAIRSNTRQIAKQLHEHYAKKYRTQIAERNSVLEKQIDSYLSFVTEQWYRANKVAVRTSLRAQLAEEFLNGLQTLFKEHYIDVPESRVDVVKQLTRKVQSLSEQNNKLIEDRMKLRRLAESANKARIVSEFGSGMSANERTKLSKLAEDVKYENAKDFREKLGMLKESYFGKAEVSKDDKGLQHLPEEKLNEQVTKPEVKKPAGGNEIGDIVAGVLDQQAKAKW